VFGHNSANFRTYFKNKSVLKTLKSAESIGATRSAGVNTLHFDRGRQSSSPAQGEIDFDRSRAFLLLFFRATFQI
jgi:hypothetical protein